MTVDEAATSDTEAKLTTEKDEHSHDDDTTPAGAGGLEPRAARLHSLRLLRHAGNPRGAAAAFRPGRAAAHRRARWAAAPARWKTAASPSGWATDIRYVNPPYIGPPLASFAGRLVDEPVGHPPPAHVERVRRVCRAGRVALRRVDHRRRGRASSLGPAPTGSTMQRHAGPVPQIPRPGHRRRRNLRPGFHQRRGLRPGRRAGASRHRHGRPRLPAPRRAAAPLLHGLHRADPRGRGRTNRLGPLRRRFRQPAGPADLAGQLSTGFSPPRRRNSSTWSTPTAPRCRTTAAAPAAPCFRGSSRAAWTPCKPSSRRQRA